MRDRMKRKKKQWSCPYLSSLCPLSKSSRQHPSKLANQLNSRECLNLVLHQQGGGIMELRHQLHNWLIILSICRENQQHQSSDWEKLLLHQVLINKLGWVLMLRLEVKPKPEKLLHNKSSYSSSVQRLPSRARRPHLQTCTHPLTKEQVVVRPLRVAACPATS